MKVSVDRIEEGIAVLIVRDGTGRTVRLPPALLPGGCREGDILDLHLEPDPAGTATACERVSGLIETLKKKG